MTTLSAVQEIVEAIGEPPPSALDTGGSSDAALAEVYLNRSNTRVQTPGWAFNTSRNVEVQLPTKKIAVTTPSSGTFQWGETVTESVTGATGIFNRIESGYMHLYPVSGTFTGTHLLTGATSSATYTGTSLTTLTTNKIAVNSSWLTVRSSQYESKRYSVQGGYILYCPPDDESTTTLSGSVKLWTVTEIAFTSVPDEIAAYIVADARVRFQRYIKQGQQDDGELIQERALKRNNAIRYDQSQYPTNVTQTAEHLAFKGNRQPRLY